nr:hypothetical protein GCM10020092_074100 [Actinoplanes digitatis]
MQIKQLTGSFLAVGLVGLVELVPAIVFGLWGGVLADAMSRRRLIIGSEMKLALLSIVLLVNALLPDPASRLWVLYMVAGLTAVFDGLQRPSLDALTPQIVRHDQLPAASALLSIRYTVGAILGPALARPDRCSPSPPPSSRSSPTTWTPTGRSGCCTPAGAVGSLLVSLTSGWYSRVHRHGRLVLVAAALTGAAVAGAGHARVRRPHRSTCERGQGRYSRGLTPYWRLNAELRAKAVL